MHDSTVLTFPQEDMIIFIIEIPNLFFINQRFALFVIRMYKYNDPF